MPLYRVVFFCKNTLNMGSILSKTANCWGNIWVPFSACPLLLRVGRSFVRSDAHPRPTQIRVPRYCVKKHRILYQHRLITSPSMLRYLYERYDLLFTPQLGKWSLKCSSSHPLLNILNPWLYTFFVSE